MAPRPRPSGIGAAVPRVFRAVVVLAFGPWVLVGGAIMLTDALDLRRSRNAGAA